MMDRKTATKPYSLLLAALLVFPLFVTGGCVSTGTQDVTLIPRYSTLYSKKKTARSDGVDEYSPLKAHLLARAAVDPSGKRRNPYTITQPPSERRIALLKQERARIEAENMIIPARKPSSNTSAQAPVISAQGTASDAPKPAGEKPAANAPSQITSAAPIPARKPIL